MQIKVLTDLKELDGIKVLQQQNLVSALSSHEAKSEGFLTAEYDLPFLREMNDHTPAIIAKDADRVIGYVLATVREVGMKHDLLRDLFETIDNLIYDDRRLEDTRYIVVGQLCVAKGYRGLGLVNQMYTAFKNHYADTFEFCVTDVAEKNPRSLKAHSKAGFKVIDKLNYGGVEWNIVLWDWSQLS